MPRSRKAIANACILSFQESSKDIPKQAALTSLNLSKTEANFFKWSGKSLFNLLTFCGRKILLQSFPSNCRNVLNLPYIYMCVLMIHTKKSYFFTKRCSKINAVTPSQSWHFLKTNVPLAIKVGKSCCRWCLGISAPSGNTWQCPSFSVVPELITTLEIFLAYAV